MSSGNDYTLEDSVYLLFTTRDFATGIPGTLSTATVSVYEDVTATPILDDVAVTESLNSVAGLNAVTIAATAANGFNVGGAYHVVIKTGTVATVSAVGEVVGNFTIGHSAAAVDLANGTDGLGAIKAQTAAIEVDTADLQTQVGTAGAGLSAIPTSAIATAVATRALGGTVAADGAIPTLEQAIYLGLQKLGETDTGGGTTQTVYDVDGTTVLATYTLNNATNPTKSNRAT